MAHHVIFYATSQEQFVFSGSTQTDCKQNITKDPDFKDCCWYQYC